MDAHERTGSTTGVQPGWRAPMMPTIALVQGDAAGVGPELMTRLLALEEVRGRANILVVSDARVFRAGCNVTGIETPVRQISDVEDADYAGGVPNLLDLPAVDPAQAPFGKVSVAAGAAVLEWFGRALDLAMAGQVDGICFMPFNKQAMRKAGLDAEDELQWARARLGHEGRASEFNVVDGMWNARVTSHIPLREVADRLTVQDIVESVVLTDRTMRGAGFKRPRIAVAALNPHAGEGGEIGTEEIDVIGPAVRQAQSRQIAVEGPFPSDTLYVRMRDRQFDCAVSMYHDQGQIAIKLLGFDQGVTVLGGLPVSIATPAHGTAYEIAGTNTARLDPARNAFLMACAMVERRAGNAGPSSPSGGEGFAPCDLE